MTKLNELRAEARAVIAGCDGSDIEGVTAKLAAIGYAIEAALEEIA